MDLLPTKRKYIDNIDVVSPILKRYRNDNDISKFRYFSLRYRYDTIWPISTRYIVWTIYRCITISDTRRDDGSAVEASEATPCSSRRHQTDRQTDRWQWL